MNNIRVRFAPSPTGPLHIGGVRTALFNYLFAKKYNGTFILRIEDTDQNRYVENAEKYIDDALNWCNIPFDEGVNKNEKFGPYRQSERKDIYAKYVQKLIDRGKDILHIPRLLLLRCKILRGEALGLFFGALKSHCLNSMITGIAT